MSPLRYVATRWAHERNPNPPGSDAWAAWNTGFLGSVMPKTPSRWAILYWAMMLGMFAACVAIYFAGLVFLISRFP